jgi:hypothetical protein
MVKKTIEHDFIIAFDEVIISAKNEKEAYRIAQKLIKDREIQINQVEQLPE